MAPSKNPKQPLKKVAIFMGALLAIVGVIGMIRSAIAHSDGATIAAVFADGKTLLFAIFGSIVACFPTIIIESIALHLDYEQGDKLKKVSDKDHESIAESVESSLAGAGEKQQRRPTILSFNQPTAKTGTI
jgi:hypothetical protein